jgi:uncharacterized protein (DUF885 family)
MAQSKTKSSKSKSAPSKAAAEHGESAIALLKKQHVEVKALFKRIEHASSRAIKAKLFDELAAKLVGHDAIEREIFYPACEKAMGMTDLLSEALVEHGVVEFSLYQADEARMHPDFSAKCQVLGEIVDHHVEEEQDDFFPKVEKAMSKEQLLELGSRMRARFEQALAQDFRAPLHHNLKQVLAGALKPTKGQAPARRVTSKRRKAA